jgi:hypothetical protein
MSGPCRLRGKLEGVIVMSRVERVEDEVQNVSAEELKAFRDWFARFDAAAWDQQIEADADNGKLRSLAERALKDHEAGRSTVL